MLPTLLLPFTLLDLTIGFTDPVLFLLRTLLIVGLIANTALCWKLKLLRRVWVYILVPFLLVYVMDYARSEGWAFHLMRPAAYAKLRQVVAVTSLNASVWIFLLTFLLKRPTSCNASSASAPLSCFSPPASRSRMARRSAAMRIAEPARRDELYLLEGHASAYLHIKGITVTGGIPFEACLERR